MPPEPKNAPRSLMELFVFFSLLALQGFGGIIAFIEKGLVQKKGWMTREEFLEDWAVARTMPGPPAINMGIIIGSRHFGAKGAIVSVVGVFLFPSFLVLGLAVLYTRYGHMPEMANALRAMGAVAAGLLIATGIKLLSALPSNVMGLKVCGVLVVITFVMIGLLHMRVAYAMFGLGGLGCIYAYRRLKADPAQRPLGKDDKSSPDPGRPS